MAKTYNTFTNVSTGDVLTATTFNNVLTNVEGYRRPPIAIVNGTANAVIATATDTVFGFTSIVDTDTMVTAGATSSTYANGGKITVTTAGVYLVQYTFTSEANATGLRYVTVAKNGTGSALNATGTFWQVYVPSASAQTSHTGGGLMSLAVNDYLQLVVHQTSGANRTYNTNGCVFSVAWVGQAT